MKFVTCIVLLMLSGCALDVAGADPGPPVNTITPVGAFGPGPSDGGVADHHTALVDAAPGQ